MTIELVKKYALDKLIDLKPEKLSDFFDVAASDAFKNNVAKNLNIVTYESVIKHTLYNNIKETNAFSLKENSSANWIEKAINLNLGEIDYFIDIEGGPDNKSFPVVCVLSKKNNLETKDKILEESNNFLSNIFGRNVTNNCLANIIGEPDKFENNFKKIPILKSKKDNLSFYNSICVVYDFCKILLSSQKSREFDAQAIAEISLGFFSKYNIQVDDITKLRDRQSVLSDIMR